MLAAIEEGHAHLVTSDYLEFEVGQIVDPERAARVRALVGNAAHRVALSPAIARRARTLEAFGLRGFDALHVAAAAAGGATLLVTTDDRMMKRAARAKTEVEVVGPAEAVLRIRKERTS